MPVGLRAAFQEKARSIAGAIGNHPMLMVFIALALVTRLVFWFYTHRVWEDALITITAARNVWEGFGLTHHASEPRVHSFTSPISVLVPMLAEQFYAGLLALRLASLAAAVATIYFAYRIGLILAFHWAAQVFVLGYLACDQLQVFFGMGGMETQIVTAIAVGALYFFMAREWRALGWTCGLATISRPEFILFLLPSIGVALLLHHRAAIGTVLRRASAVAVPWYVFATLYYGSPIPNTIIAKAAMRSRLSWEATWAFTVRSWRDFAPFKEFWCAVHAPLPDALLQCIVAAVTLLFLCGGLFSARRKNSLLVAIAAVLCFLAYRNSLIQTSYYMWYLPPFLALAFVVAGYGLTQLAGKWPRCAAAVGSTLALAYAIHLPFSMPLEKMVENGIEIDVRERTGRALAAMMKQGDTVVLEPLGFIGWAAFNKTVYDFPGLGSKVAVRAVKNMAAPTVAGLIDALQPTHAIVRPNEFDELVARFPKTAVKYQLMASVQADSGLVLRNMGYEYVSFDREFRILRRSRAFEEVVRP